MTSKTNRRITAMRKVMFAAMAMMVTAGVAMATGSGKGGASCAKMPSMTGEVTAVDAAAGKISLKDAKGVVADWTVPADAKVVKPGKKGATLADVAVGDTVTVCYEEAAGVKTVKSVKVKPPRKTKPAKKAPAAAK
jgi:Cu/Ag efflux protein CusF